MCGRYSPAVYCFLYLVLQVSSAFTSRHKDQAQAGFVFVFFSGKGKGYCTCICVFRLALKGRKGDKERGKWHFGGSSLLMASVQALACLG